MFLWANPTFIVHVDVSASSNDLDIIEFVVETDKLGRRIGETLDARYKAVDRVMVVFRRAWGNVCAWREVQSA